MNKYQAIALMGEVSDFQNERKLDVMMAEFSDRIDAIVDKAHSDLEAVKPDITVIEVRNALQEVMKPIHKYDALRALTSDEMAEMHQRQMRGAQNVLNRGGEFAGMNKAIDALSLGGLFQHRPQLRVFASVND